MRGSQQPPVTTSQWLLNYVVWKNSVQIKITFEFFLSFFLFDPSTFFLSERKLKRMSCWMFGDFLCGHHKRNMTVSFKKKKNNFSDRWKSISFSGYILLLIGVRPNTEDAARGQRRDPSGAAVPGRRTRDASGGSVLLTEPWPLHHLFSAAAWHRHGRHSCLEQDSHHDGSFSRGSKTKRPFKGPAIVRP